jgi:hypothetical protein
VTASGAPRSPHASSPTRNAPGGGEVRAIPSSGSRAIGPTSAARKRGTLYAVVISQQQKRRTKARSGPVRFVLSVTLLCLSTIAGLWAIGDLSHSPLSDGYQVFVEPPSWLDGELPDWLGASGLVLAALAAVALVVTARVGRRLQSSALIVGLATAAFVSALSARVFTARAEHGDLAAAFLVMGLGVLAIVVVGAAGTWLVAAVGERWVYPTAAENEPQP